jgi:RNA polymerase sigma-70 factor (ECF subfamily)
VLAATARVTRDLDVAEECVQEAYVAALAAWARDGVPGQPGAWLTVARAPNALNVLPRAATLQSKLPLLLEPEAKRCRGRDDSATTACVLVFTCCQPRAFARGASRPDAAARVRRRDTRDRRRVPGQRADDGRTADAREEEDRSRRIPYAVPDATELPERVDAVLTVIHLLATTGHTAPRGEALLREDLLERALDLARMLVVLLPHEPEARGLLALVLVLHARRETRGELLADQDRSTWDRAEIAEGDALVRIRAGRRPAGRFTLQRRSRRCTRSAELGGDRLAADRDAYGELLRRVSVAGVALNRAIAVSMADGPAGGAAGDRGARARRAARGYRYCRPRRRTCCAAGPQRRGGGGARPRGAGADRQRDGARFLERRLNLETFSKGVLRGL